MFAKVLIANRGEIAVRVINACRELGIKSVAVFSEADREAVHVALADESVFIGESEPAKSYLDIQKIIAAAKETGAEAIHPGYGFLSERAEFVEACEIAGIVFVGPSASAMRKLGGKIEAKTLAVQNEVPVTPGFFEPGASLETLAEEARRIGLPVMLKASAGGGGRGMRAVFEQDELDSALQMASNEARNAFGDGAMMVEKLIARPRHIEVQVLADNFGNVACLFERECSIQRRHQKLLEEAPSPFIQQNPHLWDAMQTACKRLILAANYTNAGTVEFMVDPQTGEFYFLEVNARLQVEHPVTEAVSGVDLVEWQLRIANGEPLKLTPEQMRGDRSAIRGHAVEARIVSEDPAKGFVPSIGKISGWHQPSVSGIRIDTGYAKGKEISRFYDSLLAKVIAVGSTREDAHRRLTMALQEFHILGVRHCGGYLLEVIAHPEYQAGRLHTHFLAEHFAEHKEGQPPSFLADLADGAKPVEVTSKQENSPKSLWHATDSWRNIRS